MEQVDAAVAARGVGEVGAEQRDAEAAAPGCVLLRRLLGAEVRSAAATYEARQAALRWVARPSDARASSSSASSGSRATAESVWKASMAFSGWVKALGGGGGYVLQGEEVLLVEELDGRRLGVVAELQADEALVGVLEAEVGVREKHENLLAEADEVVVGVFLNELDD